jgi:FKBP-type peptidyl-prolyl cis-trans isomerase SlpA
VEAFGERSPELVQALSRAAFDGNAEPGATFAPGDVVEFSRPGGGRLAGVLKECNAQRVLVDFNHPLAGTSLRFSVRVIGVL